MKYMFTNIHIIRHSLLKNNEGAYNNFGYNTLCFMQYILKLIFEITVLVLGLDNGIHRIPVSPPVNIIFHVCHQEAFR